MCPSSTFPSTTDRRGVPGGCRPPTGDCRAEPVAAVCDVGTGRCVECVTTSDCGPGLQCASNRCVVSANCNGGPACSADTTCCREGCVSPRSPQRLRRLRPRVLARADVSRRRVREHARLPSGARRARPAAATRASTSPPTPRAAAALQQRLPPRPETEPGSLHRVAPLRRGDVPGRRRLLRRRVHRRERQQRQLRRVRHHLRREPDLRRGALRHRALPRTKHRVRDGAGLLRRRVPRRGQQPHELRRVRHRVRPWPALPGRHVRRRRLRGRLPRRPAYLGDACVDVLDDTRAARPATRAPRACAPGACAWAAAAAARRAPRARPIAATAAQARTTQPTPARVAPPARRASAASTACAASSWAAASGEGRPGRAPVLRRALPRCGRRRSQLWRVRQRVPRGRDVSRWHVPGAGLRRGSGVHGGPAVLRRRVRRHAERPDQLRRVRQPLPPRAHLRRGALHHGAHVRRRPGLRGGPAVLRRRVRRRALGS